MKGPGVIIMKEDAVIQYQSLCDHCKLYVDVGLIYLVAFYHHLWVFLIFYMDLNSNLYANTFC